MSAKSVQCTSGLSDKSETPVTSGSSGLLARPWMSRELLEETRSVWAPRYGRQLNDDEVIEILTNVQRLAESLIRISKGEK